MSAGAEELLFVPLGGAGEIGMNFNLYGLGAPGVHRWMAIDMGITFANGAIPGVDVILPDPEFLVENRERLDGLVLSHGHEDHLGAVAYLWDRLQCPLYATPFTASILRRKLSEAGLADKAPITEVPLGGRFLVGPFELELIGVTHSIPEPNSILIRTPLGCVLHTADWKLDPGPVIGATADEEAFKRAGDEGVMAMVSDSTNVFSRSNPRSEAELLESLTALIGDCAKRVAVACFATNVARLQTVAAAARANGRDVVLAGRSLVRIDEVARENGYLADTPAFLNEQDAGFLPKDKTLIICTGSQGERRAALARIAAGDHANVTLEQGDTVIFSSKVIPGNETAIGNLQNQLIRRGVELITEKDAFVHVSGHPCRDEMIRMYGYVRPRISVPVHGELRHLVEHARLARECGTQETVVAENGAMVRLAPGAAEIVDQAPSGRLVLEGKRIVPLDGDLIRGRKKSVFNGSLVVTVVINGGARLMEDPQITSVGLVDEQDGDVDGMIGKAVAKALKGIADKAVADDDKIRYEIRIAVRRAFREAFAKNPVTSIHLVRV